MANEERHCFITEWYDSHAEIKRRYQLMHYPKVTTRMLVNLGHLNNQFNNEK